MAKLRSKAKRAEKDGVSVVFYRGTVPNLEQRVQMESISQHWLAQKGGSEWGFSMGHFDPQGDEEQITALAVDTTNRVHAFVSFIPIYGRHGWALDLLRRADCSVPGTIELLLAHSIEYLKSDGAAMVSLGLAPLSNANNDDTTLLDTGIDFLTQHFGNLSKSQSLSNFKKKFHPTWESRYLVFSNKLTLPKIGWALYKAHQEDATFLKTLRRSVLGWQKSYKAVKEKITTGALEALKV
jgi:phosphatidylglycerol lysyltransferase